MTLRKDFLMYDFISKLIADISNFMYSNLLIILLIAVGLYFTFRTKFVQLRLLGESIRLVTEKKESTKYYDQIIGKHAAVDLEFGTPLEWNMIED